MRGKSGNVFSLPLLPSPDGDELIEILARGAGCHVERIVSTGQVTPEGEWYDQENDEWVVLLSGESELLYEDGTRFYLKSGDWVNIPAHVRHRVVFTSERTPCVWLAFHFEARTDSPGGTIYPNHA